ncbi:MAG: DUF4198 domain-containing protein [Pirellulaceae bacterium]|jgi:hypothetical protein|nr:DUF4198 domain-containing protein [Pirellulaceae bacterium]
MAAVTGRTSALRNAAGGLCLLTASMFLTGCGGGGDHPVAYTTGQVLCEGKPVPHVIVFFEPLAQSKSALAGKQGIGRADGDGKFVISTYGKDDGAVIGKHRVRVSAPNSESHPDFRCDCVLNPELDLVQVDVTQDGQNEFNIVLQKKTGKEPVPLGRDDDED